MVWSKLHTASLSLFITLSLIIIVWDVCVVLFSNTPGATVSYSVYYASRRSPVIALMIGIVIGHLFWPTLDLNKPKQDTPICPKCGNHLESKERR